MDQTKIGKYIAGKRKERGMTQAELAELVGVSDKSVSKWERGVCLPDVSNYTELCRVLGITLNEFFAGEDLTPEKIPVQAEDNILGVIRNSRKGAKRLKKVIAVLLILLLAAGSFSVWMMYREGYFYHNKVMSYGKINKTAADMLTSYGSNTHLVWYKVDSDYKIAEITVREYRRGKYVTKKSSGNVDIITGAKGGLLGIRPDLGNGTFETIWEIEGGTATGRIDIPSIKTWKREGYAFTVSELEKKQSIQKGKEIYIAAVMAGRKGIGGFSLNDIVKNPSYVLSDTDSCYLVSVTFR